MSKKNYKEFIKEYQKKNGADSYIAISVKDYENLSLNFAELRRYIEQQKQIIIYYEKAVTPKRRPMAQKKLEKNSEYEKYDLDGDGIVTDEELAMDEKLMRLNNEDKKEDAQRWMAWFSLWGMLLYPSLVVFAVLISLDQAAKILGDMASVYFVSVAAIVAAFFGKEAYVKSKSADK